MAYSTGTLAQGCFGKVYRQKYNDTWAAIKKVPHQLINKKDLERECQVYNKAQHPNIVKLLGDITLKDGKWIIPLEFIFGEDLETTIFKAANSKIQLTPSIKGKIIVGMCEGLHHLHSKDIVHQDLKPENIMVEHGTNRAVIIDLGLAKFYRCGLSSAVDMGNEAYSAPEVLQRGHQRHQSSDVWAMGKIIAELCARIRLHTPSVCPAKILDILEGHAYCKAVCRMVEPNPSLRASVGGVLSEIRRAASAGMVTDTSPGNRAPSPANRDPSPGNRAPYPGNRDPYPGNRAPSPGNRAPSPANRDPSPGNRAPSPGNRDPYQGNRAPSPGNRAPSPGNRAPYPGNRAPSPGNRAPSPANRDPSPGNRAPYPGNRDPSPGNRAPSPGNRDPYPANRAPSPGNRAPSPANRDQLQINRDRLPIHRSPSPLNWERSPRPHLHHLAPAAPLFHRRTEDMGRDKSQALVPPGGANLGEDFRKTQLYQDIAKGLRCDLPTTGRVVVQRYEEKDGEPGKWETKEVVTRDGKIVKFEDVSFNSS